jgi:CrcB protein
VTPGALVAVGGAVGAVARHAVVLALEEDGGVPRATLAVNVLGSFVLGAVTALAPGDSALLLVGVGACGAFTTFSTFAVEAVDALAEGRYRAATAHATLNLVGSLGAVALAWTVVRAATV